MATPYSEIYDIYFSLCSDYEFLQLDESDQDEILESWLKNAIAEFRSCKEDLYNRDEKEKEFEATLSDNVKKILAKGMLVEWLSPQLYTLENLRNYLSTKDFSLYSPANFLKEIRETHDKALSEFERDIVRYGYLTKKDDIL